MENQKLQTERFGKSRHATTAATTLFFVVTHNVDGSTARDQTGPTFTKQW